MATPTTHRKKPRPLRRKACGSCAKSKARCSLEKPACSRCRLTDRNLEQPDSRPIQGCLETPLSLSDADAPSRSPVDNATWCPPSQQSQGQSLRRTPRNNELHFREIDLTPTSEADDIRYRCIRPYFTTTHGRTEIRKVVLPYTIQFIKRILSTYPRNMPKDGHVPPIIHHAQAKGNEISRALANCYSLVRMWEHAAPGSEEIVMSTLRWEMDRLASESPNQHDYELLCAFQAYLIYSILMYFSPRGGFSDTTMVTLKEMAFRTARNGLFCAAELASTDQANIIYNADRLLPDFIADELRGVYVPGHKALWEANDRETWNKEYDRYLSDWEDGSLVISKLCASPEKEEPKRRERIERWVQTVDEFGMMIFGLCGHIHSC
ncbi:hypothetical protein BDV29DRAFT_199077 [Aspergillus leporis]|uniref:Zn(2)-C6 fungal-type domain-containing protein n=1 Tax=Aspergillus leporis TaxID=41062 RepID=A0A5N5X9E9_9EURO|nr:hypothetical protein BDV29DRAFT_199077 [Aspergillus leporis]